MFIPRKLATDVEDPSQGRSFCPQCGAKAGPADQFCMACGAKIPQTAAAPSSPQTPPASSPSPKPQRKVGLSVLIVLGLVLLLVVGGVWMFLRSLKSQSPADKPGDANTDAPAALGTRPDVQPGKLVADSAPPVAPPTKDGKMAADAVITLDGKQISGLTAEQLASLVRDKQGAVATITTSDGGSRTVTALPQPLSNPQAVKADEHFQTGIAFAEDGKWSQAEAEYRAAVRLAPALDDCWYALGEACAEQKKWPDAVTAYQQAVRLQPDFGIYHADLALALLRQGRRPEATKEAQEAIRLQETDHPVYKELGLAP